MDHYNLTWTRVWSKVSVYHTMRKHLTKCVWLKVPYQITENHDEVRIVNIPLPNECQIYLTTDCSVFTVCWKCDDTVCHGIEGFWSEQYIHRIWLGIYDLCQGKEGPRKVLKHSIFFWTTLKVLHARHCQRSLGYSLRQERMERKPTSKGPCFMGNSKQPMKCVEDYYTAKLGCHLPWLPASKPCRHKIKKNDI